MISEPFWFSNVFDGHFELRSANFTDKCLMISSFVLPKMNYFSYSLIHPAEVTFSLLGVKKVKSKSQLIFTTVYFFEVYHKKSN